MSGPSPCELRLSAQVFLAWVAAYHLCRDHDITVFEAGNYIGGHTHTVDVEHGRPDTLR